MRLGCLSDLERRDGALAAYLSLEVDESAGPLWASLPLLRFVMAFALFAYTGPDLISAERPDRTACDAQPPIGQQAD